MHHDLDIHPIPEKVLYINELGIACLVVSFGFGDVKEMKEAGVIGVCDSMEELPGMLKKQ